MMIIYSLPVADEGLREIEVVHAVCDATKKDEIMREVRSKYPQREVHYRTITFNEIYLNGVL